VVNLCGSFTGDLHATKVIINKNARMRGDIYHEVLEIQSGADFEGRVAPLRPSPARSPGSAREPVERAQTHLELPVGLELRGDPA
jgi:cytoskeletal protein CcmA (bactofilin family)